MPTSYLWCILHALLAFGAFGASGAFAKSVDKRALCTPPSFNDPTKDDGPAIVQAFNECGDVGTVLLAANTTYNIRSPVTVTHCRACGFTIAGVLNVVPDWNLWEGIYSVFTISNITAAVIQSDNGGLIKANGYGKPEASTTLLSVPSLFSITNASHQIHFSGLNVTGVPGVAFDISENSSAAYFYEMDIDAAIGYQVRHAEHVYIWENKIRSENACVQLLPNTSNVQVQDTSCIAVHSTDSTPSGIELQLSVAKGLVWLKNTMVSNFKATGAMNVVTILTRQDDAEEQVQITNVTFSKVDISGPVKQAVYLDQCLVDTCGAGRADLMASDVAFTDFSGQASRDSIIGSVGQGYTCGCNAKAEEAGYNVQGWNVTVVG